MKDNTGPPVIKKFLEICKKLEEVKEEILFLFTLTLPIVFDIKSTVGSALSHLVITVVFEVSILNYKPCHTQLKYRC